MMYLQEQFRRQRHYQLKEDLRYNIKVLNFNIICVCYNIKVLNFNIITNANLL